MINNQWIIKENAIKLNYTGDTNFSMEDYSVLGCVEDSNIFHIRDNVSNDNLEISYNDLIKKLSEISENFEENFKNKLYALFYSPEHVEFIGEKYNVSDETDTYYVLTNRGEENIFALKSACTLKY